MIVSRMHLLNSSINLCTDRNTFQGKRREGRSSCFVARSSFVTRGSLGRKFMVDRLSTLVPATLQELELLQPELRAALLTGVTVDELPPFNLLGDQLIAYYCSESRATITLADFGFISEDNIYLTRQGTVSSAVLNGYQACLPIRAVEFHIAVRRVIRPSQVFLFNGSWERRRGRHGNGDVAGG